MRTTPGPAGAHQQDSHQQPGRHRVGDPAPLTPTERIAVTIALVNSGFDMVDGLARTCFTGWVRGLARGRHHPEQEHHPCKFTFTANESSSIFVRRAAGISTRGRSRL